MGNLFNFFVFHKTFLFSCIIKVALNADFVLALYALRNTPPKHQMSWNETSCPAHSDVTNQYSGDKPLHV